jgi:polysaccharide deacetylase 2 family uncharacterized protein YibQ
MFNRRGSGDGHSLKSGAPPWAIAVTAVVLSSAAFALTISVLWLFVPDRGPVHGSVEVALPAADPNSAVSQRPTPGLEAGLIVAPFTAAPFSHIPRLASEAPLTPAPDPALIQHTAGGGLPRIAADGRLPRQIYARPHDPAGSRAKLSVIIAGIGLSRPASEAAIEGLPAAVTLAIDAYAARPDAWAGAARRAGHELLVTVPMQEATGSLHDRGPRALLATVSADENGRRLETVLGASTGYVGVLAVGGTAFEADRDGLKPLLAAGRARGLLLVDATGSKDLLLAERAPRLGTPAISVDVVLEPAGAESIDRQLADLMTIADTRASGVVLGYANPAILERLRAWMSGLDDRRYVLAPVSAVVDARDKP